MSSGPPPEAVGPGAERPAARVPVEPPRRRRQWGAALALGAGVLFLGVLDGLPLIALPLGVLFIGLAARQRWWWLSLGVLVWIVALASGGAPLSTMSRGWGLLLGGSFLAFTLARPRWAAFSRALAAVGASVAAGGCWLAVSGGWARFEWTVVEQFRSAAALASREFFGRWPDAWWAEQFGETVRRMAELQSTLFPALLALQSLAALALVWWVFLRSRPGRPAPRPALRPLREFRFHDALVWLLIGGLLLVVLPFGEAALRAGYNVMFFMGALYVLRGVAVFVFLTRGAPTVSSVVFATVAMLLFSQIIVVAALLVGLGDTWLDVRGRVLAAASRV